MEEKFKVRIFGVDASAYGALRKVLWARQVGGTRTD